MPHKKVRLLLLDGVVCGFDLLGECCDLGTENPTEYNGYPVRHW